MLYVFISKSNWGFSYCNFGEKSVVSDQETDPKYRNGKIDFGVQLRNNDPVQNSLLCIIVYPLPF